MDARLPRLRLTPPKPAPRRTAQPRAEGPPRGAGARALRERILTGELGGGTVPAAGGDRRDVRREPHPGPGGAAPPRGRGAGRAERPPRRDRHRPLPGTDWGALRPAGPARARPGRAGRAAGHRRRISAGAAEALRRVDAAYAAERRGRAGRPEHRVPPEPLPAVGPGADPRPRRQREPHDGAVHAPLPPADRGLGGAGPVATHAELLELYRARKAEQAGAAAGAPRAVHGAGAGRGAGAGGRAEPGTPPGRTDAAPGGAPAPSRAALGSAATPGGPRYRLLDGDRTAPPHRLRGRHLRRLHRRRGPLGAAASWRRSASGTR